MSCDARYAEAKDFADFFCIGTLNPAERATIETSLDLAAGDIHAARMTVDACDCTLSSGAESFLMRLNVVLAGVIHQCPCARLTLSDQQRQMYLQWAQNNLQAISSGTLELCQGATGTSYPAFGWAEHAGTEFSRAETIIKADERYP